MNFMANRSYESIPNPDFSPEGRKLEYILVREAKKAIRESKEFSEREKSLAIRFWDTYLLDYEHLYNRKMEEEFFQNLEKNLKETDLLRNDVLANEGWRRYCIKRELKKQRTLN